MKLSLATGHTNLRDQHSHGCNAQKNTDRRCVFVAQTVLPVTPALVDQPEAVLRQTYTHTPGKVVIVRATKHVAKKLGVAEGDVATDEIFAIVYSFGLSRDDVIAVKGIATRRTASA